MCAILTLQFALSTIRTLVQSICQKYWLNQEKIATETISTDTHYNISKSPPKFEHCKVLKIT